MNLLTRRENREFFPSFIDRFWNEPMLGMLTPTTGIATIDEGSLALDVSEDDKNVIVRASLPGFKREDIEVEIDDGVLAIKATREEETEQKTETYYRKERRMGALNRRIALPSTVMEGQADADLKDGVLTLRLPKSPTAQPKKIKIR